MRNIWPERNIEPGQTWRFGNNMEPETIYVRAIVDGDQIVIRQWNDRKRVRRYSVEHPYYFKLREDSGSVVSVSTVDIT
jgi:hypothetical protein